jgi:hypothetical protein
MLNLPQTTEFNKRVPKQKFYEHLPANAKIKSLFAAQIKTIYWRNKIAASTLNISAGVTLPELEVFEVKLNTPDINESVLRQIDLAIPYYILFLLEYDGKYKAAISFKEVTENKNIKVNNYYYTNWLDEQELPLKMEGLNIDIVYENFLRQIAGQSLEKQGNTNLKQSITKADEKAKLQKQIAVLENKIRKEKQFNKKVELNMELKKLKIGTGKRCE